MPRRIIVCFFLLINLLLTAGFSQAMMRELTIDSLSILGIFQNYEYQKAVEQEDLILSFIEQSPQQERAELYNNLAWSFLQTDKAAKAEQYFNQAIQTQGSLEVNIESYYRMGQAQLRLGKFREAEDSFKRLGKIGANTPEYVLGNSDFLIASEKYAEAEKFVLASYQANPTLSDSEKARILDQLAEIYTALRLENKARSFHLESFYILSFSEEENLDEQLMFNLKEIGDLYFNVKEYEAANRAYQAAYDKSSSLTRIKDQDKFFRLREQLLLSQIYLGNYLQGIFELNAMKSEQAEFYGAYSEQLANLNLIESELYLKINNEKDALAALSRGEEILNLFSFDTQSLLKTYSRKAQFFENDGNSESALEYLNKSIEILNEKYKEPTVQGEVEYRIGRQYANEKNWDQALLHLNNARIILEMQVGSHHPSVYLTDIASAEIYHLQEDTAAAITNYKKGIRGLLECYYECSPAFSEQQKVHYLEQVQPSFYKLLNILKAQNEQLSTELINEIFSLHISIDNLLFERDQDYYIDLWSNISDDKISLSLISWLDNLDRLKNYYLNPYPFQKGQMKLIEEIRSAINEEEEIMSKKSNEFRAAREHELKTWEVVSRNLSEEMVAIDVTRFPNIDIEQNSLQYKDPHYAFFVIKPNNSAVLFYIEDAAELETKYLSYMRNTLEHSIPDYYSYDTYWKPIEEHIGGAEKIYFSAEGAFSLFNLNTLQNAEDSSFVIDKVDIRYVNSTWNISEFNPEKKSPSPKVYLLGEPDYDVDRRQIAVANPDEVKIQYDPAIVQFQKDEISENLTWNELQFQKRGNRDEIAKANELYNSVNISTVVFSGKEVREETIQGLSDIRSIHFTANAYFLENDYTAMESSEGFKGHPLNRTGLVLSGARDYLSKENTYDYSSNEDGLLTGIEISRLNLRNSELVFLSATNGNLGIIKNWEAIKHMQQAFEKAEARSIIMTLWNANPEKELEMTGYFYENLTSGKNVYESFRAAQRLMREKYEHPSNWGSMVYIGE